MKKFDILLYTGVEYSIYNQYHEVLVKCCSSRVRCSSILKHILPSLCFQQIPPHPTGSPACPRPASGPASSSCSADCIPASACPAKS